MRSQPHVQATQADDDSPRLVPFLKVIDVAKVLNISPRTVRQMIREGRLAGVATSATRGRLRVSRAALAEFLRTAAVQQHGSESFQ
jgi:excisionase family DNA binding protein